MPPTVNGGRQKNHRRHYSASVVVQNIQTCFGSCISDPVISRVLFVVWQFFILSKVIRKVVRSLVDV